MLLIVITMLLAAATQTDALFTRAMPPPEVPTFEATIRGEEPFFAGLQISGKWVTDHRMEIEQNQTVTFIVDSPFYLASPLSVIMRRVELRYEPPAMRRARLEDIWTSNGYTFLKTKAGWKPVRKEDVILAERVRKITEAAREKITAQLPVAMPFGVQKTETTLSPEALLILRVVIILAGISTAAVALQFILRK